MSISRAGSRGGGQGARAPGPPSGGLPPVAAGGGPLERNGVKIADFVKDSSIIFLIFGALCAFNFCRARAPIIFGMEIRAEHQVLGARHQGFMPPPPSNRP